MISRACITILRSKSLPNWTNPIAIVRPRCEAAPILKLVDLALIELLLFDTC